MDSRTLEHATPGLRSSFHSFSGTADPPTKGGAFESSPIDPADQTARGAPRHPHGDVRSPENRVLSGETDREAIINLTYVSENQIPAGDVDAELASLLAAARQRNRDLGITGALLFTGSRFVQTLEGTAADVDTLMTSILRDPRHAAPLIIDRRAVADRVFTRWSLTYSGPSVYVATVVARALAGFRLGIPRDVARLLSLMIEFGSGAPLRAKP